MDKIKIKLLTSQSIYLIKLSYLLKLPFYKESMINSRTQLSLQQLNEEIHLIVKSYAENDTSYFPNSQMLIESFENYLKCLGCHQRKENSKPIVREEFLIFKEQISSEFLFKQHKFINLLLDWDFVFNGSFKKLFTQSDSHQNTRQKSLNDFSIIQVILLMYMSLEVERKEIIGKVKQDGHMKMFLLKEVIKFLDQFYTNERSRKESSQKNQTKGPFSINEDKFIKILLLKSLKLKLQRENFSFGPTLSTLSQKHQEKNTQPQKQESVKDSELGLSQMQKNFSLISIKSEYNPSIVIDEQNIQKMKQSRAMMPLELEVRNLSNEVIFHNISLNQLKGYIS